MFPWIARLVLLVAGDRVFRRVAQHPRLAPIVGTRKGRFALFLIGLGLRRHRKTRLAGHAVRRLQRWGRRAR